MRMLGQSLVRLLTDHLDVWQIHEVFYHNDPELIYDSDGVLEIPTKAKQQGNVRFIGSYFVKGKGGFWKRTEYDLSREVITRGDDGGNHFNTYRLPDGSYHPG